MSTDNTTTNNIAKAVNTNQRVKSNTVQIFPASRRNVEFYNSRISSEDNFRRAICASVEAMEDFPGTLIYDYKFVQPNQEKIYYDIEFFIRGYYIRLLDEGYTSSGAFDNNPLLQEINTQIGANDGEVWVYFYQNEITGSDNELIQFNEMDCADDATWFYGLRWSNSEPMDTEFKIPIVVPKDGIGVIAPHLDRKQDLYKPWFMSSATWAASGFSDKKKIWVDEQYHVPHVCLVVSGKKIWTPLGAVYKTSR